MTLRRTRVGGHRNLPAGGQQTLPLTAISSRRVLAAGDTTAVPVPPSTGTSGIPEVARRGPNVMRWGCPVCASSQAMHPISDCSPIADLIGSGVVHLTVGCQNAVEPLASVTRLRFFWEVEG